jgi:hypothetical protein
MKTFFCILILFNTFFVFSQTTEQNNLLKNTATVEELQQLLVTDYVAMSEMNKVVPKNQFTVSNLMVLNPYGDVSAQSQAKAIEDQFSNVFNGSTWKFDAIDLQNGSQRLSVTTSSGQTESASYNCVGATFHSGTLIEGMDVDAYLFQSKTDTKAYILLLPVSNGMTVVADFTKF